MNPETLFVPKVGALQALAAWIGATLGPVTARLYDNNVVYNADRVLADYNEATFAGYAPVDPIAWGAAFTNADGKAESDSAICLWTFTGGAGSATVFGIYLTDSSNTQLMAVIPFVPAVILTPSASSVARMLQLTDVSEL